MFYKLENREEGGRALAKKLSDYKNREDVIVLALPRGGVPVGLEVAKALNLPLDVFVVRKLGVPNREELAFGAIASGGVTVINESLIKTFGIPASLIKQVIEKEEAELIRREKLYRNGKSTIILRDKIVILVDDGIATGATIKAALVAVRQLEPKQIIVASPVASRDACEGIEQKSDDLCICAMTPEPFYGVGMWYRDFEQVNDNEVCRLLRKFSGEDFKLKQAAEV